MAGACGNRTHRSRRRRLRRGFEDRPDHQARSAPNAQEGNTATASISTRAPRGSAATATVERAGRWSPKARRRPRSWRRSRPCRPGRPWSSRRWPGRAARPRGWRGCSASTRSVCSAMPPSTSSPVAGSKPDLAGGEEQPVGAGGLAVGADGARRVRGRDETDRHQNSPSMVPSGWTRIASADGVLLRPGIVMISPASATTNPAPADG